MPRFPFRIRRFAPAALCAAACWMLGACASGPPAPVVDMTIDTSPQPPAAPAPAPPNPAQANAGVYRVVAGDTLYSIAFRRGLDYRDLAHWNRIEPPYQIYPGELINLQPPATAQPVAGEALTEAAPDRSTGARIEPIPAAGKPKSASTRAPVVASRPVASTGVAAHPPATAAAAAHPSAPAAPVAELKAGGVVWRWPSAGKVIATFVDGDQTRQGIDIAGAPGDPVSAAADGEVVYSGNGLIGYGELIIIKHNAAYLSAYAHNRKRLVKEGQHVHAGQRIAELGSSASPRDELHFEIRKNGKPVNPLDYLPAR